MTTHAHRSVHGALLGTIVGDAIGLPYEALSARRGAWLLGPPDRHRFLFGRGMMSDDGEHACMTAAALCVSPTDPDRFARSLAWRLRWWLLGVPAGVGGATLRATLKLWVGFGPTRSGVWSAGNGPAMRAAVLGAAIDDVDRLRAFVTASTRLTHTDPKADCGALAVALAARVSTGGRPGDFWRALDALPDSADADELRGRLDDVRASVAAGEPTSSFAATLGPRRAHGVSGYTYHTVPAAVHAWQTHPADFAAAVRSAIECGGDTDTVAAIAGGIVAAGVGVDGIPAAWTDGLLEWPRTPAWAGRLAGAAADAVTAGRPVRPPAVGPLVVGRNAVFLAGVGSHLLRRALPPYGG